MGSRIIGTKFEPMKKNWVPPGYQVSWETGTHYYLYSVSVYPMALIYHMLILIVHSKSDIMLMINSPHLLNTIQCALFSVLLVSAEEFLLLVQAN